MTAATKLGRVVKYNEELPSKKSQNLLTKLPFKIKWQIKYVKSLPSQGLWSSNLA